MEGDRTLRVRNKIGQRKKEYKKLGNSPTQKKNKQRKEKEKKRVN